ncbi:hypothetical protein DBV33_20755 [Pseudomonas fluorescens]|nr:hypothetical protein DBV33_20755 [Pseudomonas fluorescens]
MAEPLLLIVPMLRVGMHTVTLCVTRRRDAERPGLNSHAERGNDHVGTIQPEDNPAKCRHDCQPFPPRLLHPARCPLAAAEGIA